MKQIHKDYVRPFLLEKTKLDRVLNVIHERLGDHQNTTKRDHFEAFLAGNRRDEMSSVDDVLELDNAHKSKIQRILITCSASRTESAARPEHEIEVDFDGRDVTKNKKVTVSVRSDNAGWASRALSEIEEQVERTSLQDAPHRVALGGIGVLAAAVLLWVVASTDSGSSTRGNADVMWFRQHDVDRIEQILKQNRTITDEELREITTRQLSNFLEDQRRNRPTSSVWTRQKISLGVTALIILACVVYLGATCYPSAVFLWGDEVERYNRMLLRRRGLWTVIIGTTVIGVLSKLLFVALFGP